MRLIERAGFSIRLHWAVVVSHLLFFGGLGTIVYGAGLVPVYGPPLRVITGGCVAVWLGYLLTLETKPK